MDTNHGQIRFAFQLSSQKEPKLFYNCVYDPLLPEDDDTTVLSVIPPPELHLMLGIVNLLFKAWGGQIAEWSKSSLRS